MSEPSDRIHAALHRFKAARAAAGRQQIESTEPEGAMHPLIVVNEQNLAAVFSSEGSQLHPKAPVRKLVATNSRY